MDVRFSKAANAYANNLGLGAGAGDSGADVQDAGKPSFSDMLANAVSSAIDTQYKAEGLKEESIATGRVELSDLVTAISNAELTLSTVTAIRDRVITAYQDIIRMPM